MRRLVPAIWMLLTVGCHAVSPSGAVQPTADVVEPASVPVEVPVVAELQPTEKVELAKSHLRIASDCLGNGDQEQACKHLARYVSLHPDQRTGRLFYSEVLLKLNRLDEARRQYEQTAALLLDEQELDHHTLSHVHGQLMRIAEDRDELRTAHVHRGIGLYWLAQERSRLNDPEGDFSVEGIVCRAIAELTRAKSSDPNDARTHWYLHCCFQMLGQTPQAKARLLDAERCLPISPLCAAEQRSVVLARQRWVLD
ncbi:MAG: tetratricopeptide repeat protein [Gemmataceae bacterium]|nr:tetratricopeptide repeat protein [Gemmataceae bacterium]